MCSRDFLKTMENYQGDLTDILRPICGSPPAETPIAAPAAAPEWQFPTSAITFSASPSDDFGDPFVHLGDPMIHSIDAPPPPPPPLPGFFHSTDMIKPSAADEAVGFVASHKILDDEMKRPPNIFSRMLQISPTAKLPLPPSESPAAAPSPTGQKGGGGGPPMLVANDPTLISPMRSKGNNCLTESSLQISSPRNTGIRRRKSQAKKVVCIPAPAPANSRPSGEIVPSDLWAWRKYGQKPIKGSPYPRGYYRCSSSKGCSARKQVERSRTDPNMLVITYTSEHNHPWPTQRNALAGSTRAQPSKTTAAAAKNSPKEEACSTENGAAPPAAAAVKEEADREFEMADEGEFSQSYKPTLPESNQSEESFFAGLGEIGADSLDMLFTQGFDARDSKGLDSFGFYDWGGSNACSAAAAAGEDERES